MDEKLLSRCYGGRIDKPIKCKLHIIATTLFIPHEYCQFPVYGGRIDKVKVYLICVKRVQKVDERGQNVLQKLR
nr:MAG TPA: hypothetical protein [Caudoviricetes sp.]